MFKDSRTKKKYNLNFLIFTEYIKSAILPILIIEVVLLIVYFGVNSVSIEKNQQILTQLTIKNLKNRTQQEANKIDISLKQVKEYALFLQKEHENYFYKFRENKSNCFNNNEKVQALFKEHKSGAFYKSKNNGGGALYYSNLSEIDKNKAYCTESFDQSLKNIVEINKLITQTYINTYDNMNRIYPFIKDPISTFGTDLNITSFNFYYEADQKHNPEKKPVWTDVYLDPAGQGMMTSLIVPIYSNNFLEGVTGLDITIDSFVKNILNLKLPWNSFNFMLDKNNHILAMQPEIQELLASVGEKKIQQYIGSANLEEPIKCLSEIALDKHQNDIVEINNSEYILTKAFVSETGWILYSMIDKNELLEPLDKIRDFNNKLGYVIIFFMIIFYILFFFMLLSRSKRLAVKISSPIQLLSQATSMFLKKENFSSIREVGIYEIDNLNHNFNKLNEKFLNTKNEISKIEIEKIKKEEQMKTLEKLSFTDRLTGLYNRYKIDELLEYQLEQASRYNKNFGVIFIDVDHFKSVNDTYGHQVGDDVLISLATILRKRSRKSDSVGRWGGEEFIILTPETNKKGIIKFAEDIRREVESFYFPAVGHKTASLGVTIFQKGDTTKTIVKRADDALYIAKENGRNRVIFN
jgi:diguanylate cyclase (GGDEF)-like protein